MNYGIQISSLLFILATLGHYLLKKRIPLISTKVFTFFIAFAILNIVFELASLHTLYHYSDVPQWLNRLTHQFFIGSLDITVLFLFLYIDLKTREQKRYTALQLIVRLIPTICALFMVIFGELNYKLEGVRYSYGFMAMSVYITVFVYIVWTIILVIRNSKFTNESRIATLSGIILWGLTALIQMIVPVLLISSLGIALMVWFLYISMENPKEYIDYEISNQLNAYAFNLMTSEYVQRINPHYLIVACTIGYQTIDNAYKKDKIINQINEKTKRICEITHTEIFHITKRSYAMYLTQKKFEDFKDNVYRNDILEEANIYILEIPKYAKSTFEIIKLIEFLEIQPLEGKCVEIDDTLLDKQEYISRVEDLVVSSVYSGELDVYFQPIYSTKDHLITSAEALVRLRDTSMGYISPEVFIPMLEKRGLIELLDKIVLEKTCAFIVENKLWEYKIEYIEINASGYQAVEDGFPDYMRAMLKSYGVSPGFINIEITETAATQASKSLKLNVDAMRKDGFHFSMDDFGTGYSNLEKMSTIHFDIIKIDKSILWAYFKTMGPKEKAILDYSIQLIHGLGRQIVVEGVETEEMKKYLEEHNVAYLQGFYYSKPIPGKEFLEYIKKFNFK